MLNTINGLHFKFLFCLIFIYSFLHLFKYFEYNLVKKRKLSSKPIIFSSPLEVDYKNPFYSNCLNDNEDRRFMDEYYNKGGDLTYQMNLDYLQSNSIVFDVGGNKGGFVEFAKMYPVTIYVFEPILEFYNFLKEKYSTEKFPHIHFLNYGIDKFNGQSYITIDGVEGSASSQYSQITGTNQNFKNQSVTVRTLDVVMQELGIQSVNLLNINCEGCEFSIMESLIEKQLMKNISNIQIQFHPNIVDSGTVRRCKIRYILNKTHKEKYNFPWIWEFWTSD